MVQPDDGPGPAEGIQSPEYGVCSPAHHGLQLAHPRHGEKRGDGGAPQAMQLVRLGSHGRQRNAQAPDGSVPLVSATPRVLVQDVVELGRHHVDLLGADPDDWPIALMQLGYVKRVLPFFHNIVVKLVPMFFSLAVKDSIILVCWSTCAPLGRLPKGGCCELWARKSPQRTEEEAIHH